MLFQILHSSYFLPLRCNAISFANTVLYNNTNYHMWCDPTITLDLTYATLIPTLDSTTISHYPIDSKNLKKIINQSISQFNIKAAIGAITLFFLKNSLPNLRKQFQVVHLSNMDRIFYLLSQRSMSNKLQNHLYQFVKITASKWFEETPKPQLQKILSTLKGELNIFQKALQYVNDEKGQKKELSIRMLKLFLSVLEDEKTKGEKYIEKFEDHGLYIYNNKKQLFLLNAIYQIQFLLVANIHKQQQLYNPEHLIAYIEKKLFNFTINRRFSVLIENMAFLLRKLFIIKNNNCIPANTYSQFLLRIEQVIDRFFSRIKLSQRIDFYVYHMKENHFFAYLQHIFDPNIYNQYKIINKWKCALKDAILECLPSEIRDATVDQIEESIFFLQLRKRSESQQVKDFDEFPFIGEKIIVRTITNHNLRVKGIDLSLKIMQLLQKVTINMLFEKCNILQKGIIFYYMHYFQNYTFNEKEEQKAKQTKLKLTNIKNTLSNQYIIELVQFYLIGIELGNFYCITNSTQKNNHIHYRIYEVLIDLLYNRIFGLLSQYKKIETTKQIYCIKIMTKYLLVLIKGICSQYEFPYICKSCKQVNEGVICNECEYICVGIKLYGPKSQINLCRDKYFYQEMICNLRQKSQQVHYNISGDMQISTNQWLYMLMYVLQTLVPL